MQSKSVEVSRSTSTESVIALRKVVRENLGPDLASPEQRELANSGSKFMSVKGSF
jgi:hypothetical protein